MKYPTVESERNEKGYSSLRALAQLIKVSDTLGWGEIAAALADKTARLSTVTYPKWQKLCNLVGADEQFYETTDGQECYRILESMFYADKADFGSLAFDTISRNHQWSKYIREAEDALLKRKMHFTVEFDGDLESLAKVYCERSGRNLYESKSDVMDFYLVKGGFNLKGSQITIDESLDLETEELA